MKKNTRREVREANRSKDLDKVGDKAITKCPSRHWVGFLFMNKETGRRYAGLKVKIKLPDKNTAEEFQTDNNGIIEFKDCLKKGTCEIFCDLPSDYRNTLAIIGDKRTHQKKLTQKDIDGKQALPQKPPPPLS